MSQVGCLGDIIFSVSSDFVETFNNAQWNGAARYSTHYRHLYHAMTEFTGLEADTFPLEMYLSSELGVNVMEELVKIWVYERAGEALPLAIGEKMYGKYRWVIRNHRIRLRTFDRDGNLTSASVTVNLLEYLNV